MEGPGIMKRFIGFEAEISQRAFGNAFSSAYREYKVELRGILCIFDARSASPHVWKRVEESCFSPSECEEKKKLWERGTAEWHERKTLLRRRGAERLRCWGWDVEHSEATRASLSQRKHGAESRKPFGIPNSWKNMSKLNIYFLKREVLKMLHGAPVWAPKQSLGLKILKMGERDAQGAICFVYKKYASFKWLT